MYQTFLYYVYRCVLLLYSYFRNRLLSKLKSSIFFYFDLKLLTTNRPTLIMFLRRVNSSA